jgi:hypothetical protein
VYNRPLSWNFANADMNPATDAERIDDPRRIRANNFLSPGSDAILMP